MEITCDGKPIKNSPFVVHVVAAAAVPAHSKAEGEGLHSAISGDEAAFTVITADRFDNALYDPNALVRAILKEKVEGEAEDEEDRGIEIDLLDNKDGTYTASYLPLKAGDYNVHVTVNADEIVDSPFHVRVYPGAVKPIKSEAEGEGLHTAVCGEPASFVVKLRDQHGNAITDHQGVAVAGHLHNKGFPPFLFPPPPPPFS